MRLHLLNKGTGLTPESGAIPFGAMPERAIHTKQWRLKKMAGQRSQVEVKAAHKAVLAEIQEALGGASQSDAIAFLIHRYGKAALACLSPEKQGKSVA
jgi:hypothetical protein